MSDDALLTEFSVAGSETAFAALVRRHADLVYATARRQVGDAGLAEEITQNVFVALARKSRALRGSRTISGWLYRTTLLESRRALRAELRRQRRESVAGEWHRIDREGQSPWAALVPLLDEGLSALRESDRVALLLRFFEGQPFREIGRSLGISEDAAQKRVAHSVARLAAFFQRRGLAMAGAAAGITTLFAEASAAAPAAAVAGVIQAGVAAGNGAGLTGLSWLLFRLMNLTKYQTAAASAAAAVLLAIPTALDYQTLQQARAASADLAVQLAAARASAEGTEARRDDANQRLASMRRFLEMPVPSARPTPGGGQSGNAIWNAASPVARVPKELLNRVRVSAIDSSWKIRPSLASLLALTPDQTSGLQQAIDKHFVEISALEEAHLERLAPADGVAADPAAPALVQFRIRRYEPEANAARLRLREQIQSFLDPERSALALRYLDFAPADRPASGLGDPPPDEDYFGQSGLSSVRWNFHGYERTLTLQPPPQIGLSPTFAVDLKFGPNRMSFSGDRALLNPATAPSLRAAWSQIAAAPAPNSKRAP